MTVPTESDTEWLDDGHTARVRLQDRALVAEILCPHDTRDLTVLPIGDVPACRRDADEYDDNGNLVGPGPALDRCVLAEIASTWQNDELWAPDTADFEVRVSPFPVWWRGRDQDDIEIKPAPAAPESLLDVVRRQRAVGPHPAPGQDEPTHPGPEAECTDPACVKSRAQHEAAAEIQDLTAELLRGHATGGAS